MQINLKDSEIEKMTFEDSFKMLEKIIDNLESSESNLDESIQLYELGIKLKNHCDLKLKNAEMKIKKVVDNNKLENFDE
tara:strand:+ start:466 stop:702 length:237 start_codon:yes stop_codon:yes gene_type:complete